MNLSELSNEELIVMRDDMASQIAILDVMQKSFKVLANSIYGALGCPYFRFYDSDIASAVTLSGQAAITNVERDVNQYGIDMGSTDEPAIIVTASDTDSLYISISNLISKLPTTDDDKLVAIIDKYAETKLQSKISHSIVDLGDRMNAYDNKLYMKRESITKALLVAKKRFLFKVYDNEGVRYATPELKITGLESQRSSTPAWCRQKLIDAYWLFFDATEADLQKFVKSCREEFYELELSMIAGASSANNMDKFLMENGKLKKGTPMHIKATYAYNNLLVAKKLEHRYNKINTGEKIKVVALREPNPTKNDAIAFSGKIPPEFGIEQFVDRDAMFMKFFHNPLQRVADAVGWSCDKRITLDML